MILEKLKLKVVKQINNAVFEVSNAEGMVFYWIDHPKAKALIAKQGAHLVSYRPNPGKETLWLSDDSQFTRGKAIRGGVPICWPRFGNLGDESLPKHGFARTSLWSLDETITREDSCSVRLSLNHSSVPGIALTCSFTFSNQLHIELETKNNSQHEFEFTGALHSYFITDVKKLHIGSLGTQYFDALSQKVYVESEGFKLSKETDRIYLQSAANNVISNGEHSLNIHHSGNDSVVVWNPGEELANKMDDVSDYSQFICVETAITQSPVCLAPKQSHCLQQIIS
ncbi:D-hexose-6-phosphate mutarotase [Agarivorans sp. Alg241-V36]|uniref:D-hexose-6-phosphate mutarotase n=1 Tax=Agarivorans sp. Alg241-V36 TaxID=2305992 RepID=UPI0013D3AE4A|nr:D-hexose-6-phosphate mutarotase [Agarivorans sp. Alg241-V36]